MSVKIRIRIRCYIVPARDKHLRATPDRIHYKTVPNDLYEIMG